MLLVSILYCFPSPLAKLSIFRQSSKKDCQLLKIFSWPSENKPDYTQAIFGKQMCKQNNG